jgi:hypothetical protein
MDTLDLVLLVSAGVLLIFYIVRRRARLRAEESDKK